MLIVKRIILILGILVIAASVFLWILFYKPDVKILFSKEEAFGVAKSKAIQLNYSFESITYQIKKFQTPLNDCVWKELLDSILPSLKQNLEGKKYWMVYFYPKEDSFGGDLCIFVDSQNGQILDYVEGM